jgi:hypothetical protein
MRILICGILLLTLVTASEAEDGGRALISRQDNAMMMMDDDDKSVEAPDETLVDFRTHLIMKIVLALLVFKSIAGTFLLLILAAVIPAFNPEYVRK